MQETIPNKRVEEYLERLHKLYSNVYDWLSGYDPKAKIRKGEPVMLDEETAGHYPAPTLEIELGNGRKYKFEPVGCDIIAAAGRVDLWSDFGREILVYLEKNPEILSILKVGNRTESTFSRQISSQEDVGWIWNIQSLDEEMPILDRFSFQRLMEYLGE